MKLRGRLGNQPDMNVGWMKQYSPLEAIPVQGESLWLSPGSIDALWDDFLAKAPLGQFQQSSLWAEVKSVDGWECKRVVATVGNEIVGGFQLLWRQTRLGRIGYVSKGPVAEPETPDRVERLVVVMCDLARKYGIRAMIVQPPDESEVTSNILDRFQFIRSNPMEVIETTLVVDVSKGHEDLDRGMNRNSRRRVRLAKQGGLVIREGKTADEDIGLFFNLMSETCRRQGTRPNPGSVETLGQLWRTFSKYGKLHVLFAEYNGETVSGLLSIPFGNKVSLWKKGWNFKRNNLYPNDLLYYEALHWACSNQYGHCDFAALDKSIADTLLTGGRFSEAQEKKRDMFNIRFGGVPKILPPARVWIADSIIRHLYNQLLERFGLLSLIKKVAL